MFDAEIQHLLNEIYADLNTPAILVELLVLAVSMGLAWVLSGRLQKRFKQQTPESWSMEFDGVNRAVFPLLALIFVTLARYGLHHIQHTSALFLASKLLLAMAVVRVAVYALRYIFHPSSWLRATENAIVSVVWGALALHFLGVLPEIADALNDINFGVGKHRVTLLLLIQAVFTVVVTLILSLWLSRVIEIKLMTAEQIDMNLRVVMTKLVRILLSLVGVLVALSAIGFDITLLSVFGGALGVGLGFGLQKIASNYVSGFIILLDNSLHLGDVLTVEGHQGVVHQLKTRYLVLRKGDGTEVVIPNETLITSAVVNHSYSNRNTQIELALQVSYDSPLEVAMQLLKDAAYTQVRVLKQPEPSVVIKGFGENGIDLKLQVWVSDPENGATALQSALFLEIWRCFQKNDISIPFPQREVRMLVHDDRNLIKD